MKRIVLMLFLAFCSVVSAKTYYAAPNTAIPPGNDGNSGTITAPWATFQKAFKTAMAGDTVFFRGGVYYTTSTQLYQPPTHGYNGTRDKPICYFAYPGEVPIVDGIKKTTPSEGLYFFNVNNIHLKGINVRNNRQLVEGNKSATGMYFYLGNNITVEECISYNQGMRGFYFYETDTALIYNCDSYNNADTLSSAPGNAGDGFLVWDSGGEDDNTSYIVLRKCRAWHNSDDGYDVEIEGYLELDSCWASNNGYLIVGNGMGFKYGLKNTWTPRITKKVTNCISAYNKEGGFNTNDAIGRTQIMHVYNNTSYHNSQGYIIFNNTSSTDEQELQRIYRNNIAYANSDKPVGLALNALYTHDHNSWDIPLTLTTADFISLGGTDEENKALLASKRQSDGSLPDLNGFLKLSSVSKAIDAGVNVGHTYNKNAPDLGAWEYDPQTSTNKYPSVVITSPLAGSTFTTPAAVSITANASDADGPISKVEFFNGAVKLGEKTSSPWSFAWSNVQEGTYSLTAVATDTSDAKTISSPVSIIVNNPTPVINQPLVITIITPVAGSTFTAPASITITASASDPDGTVTKVEFYIGTTKLGEKASAPWSFAWNNVPIGTYSVTAIATNNLNEKTTSSAVTITVNDLPPVINQPPAVSILSPSKGQIFNKYADIIVDAIASDPDGTISKVEFYNGINKLAEITTAPYSYTWKYVDEGTYSITAIASDNLNAAVTSLPVWVEVEAGSSNDVSQEIFNLYPNPNDGHFSIVFIKPLLTQSGWNKITINSIEGKLIFEGTILKEELTKEFDLSYIKPGFYILVISRDEIIVTKKFIKI